MSEKRQVIRAAGIVGFFTLLSRLTGVIRDSIMASLFGAGRMQDIFQIAFELPNMVRRVMGEGALSAFIVPLLNERRERDGDAAAWEFFNRAANLMTFIAFLIAIFGMFFAREAFLIFGAAGWYLNEIASSFGFHVPETAQGMSPAEAARFVEQGAHMTRVMFPYVIGLTLSAMMMGACHSLRKFGAASFGSIMLNLTIIVAGGAALALHTGESTTAEWLCWSVLAGAVLRVALMVPTLWRAGWRWRASLSLRDPEVVRLMSMMGLAILTMSISQINIVVSNLFAVHLGEGIKSALVFSQRLIQFPMALTATAVATGMLPQLTAYLLQGRGRELRDMMAFTKRLEMILINPAMIGLMVFGLPIVRLLYEHRNWTAQDSTEAYVALLWYAPGLLPLGWMRLLTPLCYARKDMITPFKAALWSMLANVFLNWYFALHTSMNQAGLALANTLATYINYGFLAWYLRNDLHEEPGDEPRRLAETFWKAMAAALIACGAVWFAYRALIGAVGEPRSFLLQCACLLPALALTAALYFAVAHFIRVPDMDKAIGAMLKKLRRR